MILAPFLRVVPVLALILIVLPPTARAGPLTPPPGPVVSTGRFSPRTEITSLPFSITTSGAYYLGMNLVGVPGANGIEVAASNVDIDLNGFALFGGPGSLDGIIIMGVENVTVHDGFVFEWFGGGIIDAGAGNHHFYNVNVAYCSGTGISSAESIIRNVTVFGNGGVGINVFNNSKVTNALALFNGSDGIVAGAACHLSDSVAAANGGNGFWLMGPGCVLIGSVADGNGGDGVVTGVGGPFGGHCRIVDTIAQFNGFAGVGPGGGDGFYLDGVNNTVQGCTALNNFNDGFGVAFITNTAHDCTAEENGFGGGFGFGFSGVQRVTDCSANRNATTGILVFNGVVKNSVAESNSVNGFEVVFSHISDCTARTNGVDGFFVTQSRVRDNESTDNGSDGIEGTFGNYITGNNCNGHFAGNGIFITGGSNAIDENHCVFNAFAAIDTGSVALGLPNEISRNRETGNPFGYFLDFGANTYGGVFFGPGLMPPDPNANITY